MGPNWKKKGRSIVTLRRNVTFQESKRKHHPDNIGILLNRAIVI